MTRSAYARRRIPALVLAAAAAAAGVAGTAGARDVVERRGAEPALEGTLGAIDEAGVRIRSRLGADHLVPWDRVRRVVSDEPMRGLDRRMETALELWRARSRVERGDTALAEPLLARLFEHSRGQTHETALVVAEGLLRCRIDRADQALAVIPALEVARLRGAGVSTESYATLAPVIDPVTSLCPMLAPAWLPGPLLAALESDLATWDPQGDAVMGAIAALYRAGVRRCAQMPEERLPTGLPEHPGVALLADLTGCSAGTADQRESSRQRLSRRLDALPSWAQAWARYAIGMSLLGEDGRGRKQQGMVSLAHLPARYARSQPFLAGLSLGYIAAGLEQTGDSEGADTMRTQVQRSFPDHPVVALGLQRLAAPDFRPRPPSPERPERPEPRPQEGRSP